MWYLTVTRPPPPPFPKSLSAPVITYYTYHTKHSPHITHHTHTTHTATATAHITQLPPPHPHNTTHITHHTNVHGHTPHTHTHTHTHCTTNSLSAHYVQGFAIKPSLATCYILLQRNTGLMKSTPVIPIFNSLSSIPNLEFREVVSIHLITGYRDLIDEPKWLVSNQGVIVQGLVVKPIKQVIRVLN